jgi:flagella basal body P-ring formation protein FlgA
MLARFAIAAAFGLAALLAGFGAAAQETTVVPKRVIYPGEALDATLVSQVNYKPRKLPAPIAMVPEDVEGKVARRTLLPGRLIPLSYLREAYTVEAGSPVDIVFVSDGLVISVAGVPLQPGSVGDLIRVRNVDSGAVLTGTVMADGTVRVGAT